MKTGIAWPHNEEQEISYPPNDSPRENCSNDRTGRRQYSWIKISWTGLILVLMSFHATAINKMRIAMLIANVWYDHEM